MPHSLYDVFGMVISQIQDQAFYIARQAMEVMKWTFLAKRQLTIDELRHAVVSHLPETEIDWDDLPSANSLVDCCLGLVVLDKETSNIRLVHRTLFDYLEAKYHCRELFARGDREIAQTCLQYMSFHDIYASFHRHENGSYASSKTVSRTSRQNYHFLEYAIKNWGRHSTKDPSIEVSELAVNLFFRRPSNCISQGLYHLAYYKEQSRDQLSTAPYIQPDDSNCGLHAAAYFGDAGVVESLLETQSNTIGANSRCIFSGMTLLHLSSEEGHCKIVDLLLRMSTLEPAKKIHLCILR
jgi:hypothetical protein